MELDSIRGEVSAEEIRIAIVGAINTYLNDVLRPHGIINEEADQNYPDRAQSERNIAKYQIAKRAALVALGIAPDFSWREED